MFLAEQADELQADPEQGRSPAEQARDMLWPVRLRQVRHVVVVKHDSGSWQEGEARRRAPQSQDSWPDQALGDGGSERFNTVRSCVFEEGQCDGAASQIAEDRHGTDNSFNPHEYTQRRAQSWAPRPAPEPEPPTLVAPISALDTEKDDLDQVCKQEDKFECEPAGADPSSRKANTAAELDVSQGWSCDHSPVSSSLTPSWIGGLRTLRRLRSLHVGESGNRMRW